MILYSIELIENEVSRLQSIENPNEHEQIILNTLQKELVLLKKIFVDCDMTGSIEEFEERLTDINVYLIEPDLYQYMLDSTVKLEEIKEVCNDTNE